MSATNAILSLSLVPSFFAGVLIARGVIEKRMRAERDRAEEEMTSKVRARYRAYEALESQVRRIFTRLDEMEQETSRSLERTDLHLRNLGSALAAYEGRPAQDTSSKAPTAGVVVVKKAGWPNPEPADMAEWQRKLEALRDEKRVEIERQGKVISELTERMQALQPQADRVQRLEQDVERWQEKCMRLESEAAYEEQRVSELEVLGQDAERRVAELQQRLEEWARIEGDFEAREVESKKRVQRMEGELEGLRAVAVQHEGLLERTAELQRSLDGERAQNVREVEGLRAEVERQNQALATLQGELAQREASLSEMSSELRSTRVSVGDLESSERQRLVRIADLERELGNVESLLAAVRTETAQAAAELERMADGARSWENRAREVEIEKGAMVEVLQQRVRELEPLAMRVASLETQVEDYELRVTSMRRRSSDLENLRGQLEDTVRNLTIQRDAAVASLASDRAQWNEQRVALEAHAAELAGRVEASQQDGARTLGRMAELETRCADLERSLEGARKELEGAHGQVAEGQGQCRDLRAQMDELRVQFDQRKVWHEASEAALQASRNERNELDERLAAQVAKSTEAEAARRRGDELVVDLNRQIEGLLSELAQSQGRAASADAAAQERRQRAEQRENELQGELAIARAMQSEQAGRIEHLTHEVHALQGNLSEMGAALNGERQSARSARESLEWSLGEERARRSDLERALEAAQRGRAEIESTLEGVRRELESERGVASERAGKLAATERSLEDALARSGDLERGFAAEIAEHQHRNEATQHELENERARRIGLEEEKSQNIGRIERLEEERDCLVNQARALESEVARVREEASAQGVQLSTVLQDLENARRTSEALREEAHSKHTLVEAAESVLAELRPKLEALEAQLHAKHAPR